MSSPFRAVSVVMFVVAIKFGIHAQDFFDADLDADTDLITIRHDHDHSDGYDLDQHDEHGLGGVSHGVHSLKANGVFLQTSSGQAEHSGASNEHIDRGHDHILLDGDEISADKDSLVSNEAPNSALQTGALPGNQPVHVPDLTNHALPEHSQFTGLHGMATPSILVPNT